MEHTYDDDVKEFVEKTRKDESEPRISFSIDYEKTSRILKKALSALSGPRSLPGEVTILMCVVYDLLSEMALVGFENKAIWDIIHRHKILQVGGMRVEVEEEISDQVSLHINT